MLSETILIIFNNGFADIIRLLIEEIKNSEAYSNILNRALNIILCNDYKEVADFLIREDANMNIIIKKVPTF